MHFDRTRNTHCHEPALKNSLKNKYIFTLFKKKKLCVPVLFSKVDFKLPLKLKNFPTCTFLYFEYLYDITAIT